MKDRRILICGAGVTGGATARALQKRKATIELTDDLVTEVEGFKCLLPDDVSLDHIDLLIVSPGWKENHPLVLKARKAGIEITNEIDLAWEIKCEVAPQQRWIAVTGTNGKTTTVEMATACLRAAGIRAVACGNVGKTVIESVESEENYEVLVLEISSFQLHWMKRPHFQSVALLNIAHDHLDWHGSFDSYADAKISLLSHTDLAILNAGDAEVVGRTSHWSGRKVFYSLDTPAPGELGIVEEILIDRAFVPDSKEASMICELADIVPTVPHSVSNALAAAGLALSVGVKHEEIQKALANFKVGRHRAEIVLQHNEITWIDDSKATNPHAAAASISSISSITATPSTIWIAGGIAKGADMSALVAKAGKKIKAAILIGEDRDLIANELQKHAPDVEIFEIDPPEGYERVAVSNLFMESVVRKALAEATSGDTVLLAPACASMDQFVSYADRGNRFVDAVKKVVQNGQ